MLRLTWERSTRIARIAADVPDGAHVVRKVPTAGTVGFR